MLDSKAVLDAMTANIVDRKQAASLTPVGLEKPSAEGREQRTPLDGRHDVRFPYDDQQTVHQAIIDALKIVTTLTYHVEHVRDGLLVLAEHYGVMVTPPPVAVAKEVGPKIDRAKEAATTARIAEEEAFAANFEAQSKKAQEQAFGTPHEVIPPVPVPDTEQSGWGCPKHGHSSLTTLTSRRGRVYRSCLSCTEFERN